MLNIRLAIEKVAISDFKSSNYRKINYDCNNLSHLFGAMSTSGRQDNHISYKVLIIKLKSLYGIIRMLEYVLCMINQCCNEWCDQINTLI